MDSFDELYQEHQRYVYNIVRRIVGVEDAEDVAQQTWIKVWRGEFRGEALVTSWLFRVAQNTSISHLRAKGVRISAEPLDEDALVYAEEEHPDARFERRLQRYELYRRIRGLAPNHREALLASLDDSPLKSRSERLGIPVPTLKTRTWRARVLVTTS